MAQYQLPEILRTPLEELCLQIKSLQLGNIEMFLGKALEPPDLLSIHNAVELLEMIGGRSRRPRSSPRWVSTSQRSPWTPRSAR